MYRFSLDYLKEWKTKPSRKPLVIRGARQVGKSFLVRMFAEQAFDHFVELNFEKNPDLVELFDSKSTDKTISLLEAKYNLPIQPGKTLLFLDEIQAAPQIFAMLRYFREEKPNLHIIAAGSLLEFLLEEHQFSMPVGRIEYLHLGPMLFEEFLLAFGKKSLYQFLCQYQLDDIIPSTIHNDLLEHLKQYFIIGGMPEAVGAFIKKGNYRESDEIKESILTTYRDDFSKYAFRTRRGQIEKVFRKIPQLVGKKFKYSQVDREERSRDLKEALLLLSMARVVHLVYHSSSNGLPLGAQKDERHFKVLFLDVGLQSQNLGLNSIELEKVEELNLVNAGSICEQFIGQHLLYSCQSYKEPELYYWLRETKNRNAEIDYVITIGSFVMPVEVKAGKSGRLKSLHQFLHEKNCRLALRFNSDLPSLLESKTIISKKEPILFNLLSLPLYMVGQARRLMQRLTTKELS